MTGEGQTLESWSRALELKLCVVRPLFQMQQLHERAGEDLHTLIRRHASHPDTPPSGQPRQVTVYKMNHGYAPGRLSQTEDMKQHFSLWDLLWEVYCGVLLCCEHA